MECNKDEAVRAKEIAERKISEKKFANAKKFALKAQNLFPALEGLSEMLTTLDVYISAEKRISGEIDWYGVLGVNPWDDDETAKKQYRKLALTLHPDKNKSQGADGAFKLVSEAWSLLSDKAKKLAYNQRRNSSGFQQKISTQGGVRSAPHGTNGFQNFTNRESSNKRNQNNNSRIDSSSVHSPSNQKTNTFWTICNQCKTHYEYLRIYLNHTLLCPNCQEAFCAVEKPPPRKVLKSSYLSSHQQHNNFLDNASNSKAANFGTGGTFASSSTSGQAASVVQLPNDKAKRGYKEDKATYTWESHAHRKMHNSSHKIERLVKKRRIDDKLMKGHGGDSLNQTSLRNGGVGLGRDSVLRKGDFESERVYGFSGTNNSKSDSVRELSWFETRNMLMAKARTEICNKVKEWSSVTKVDNIDNETEDRKQKGAANGLTRRLNKYVESAVRNKRQQKRNPSANDKEKAPLAPLSMNVPDPDFHNFDLERNEKSFGEDQVWAAYDADDGMPRYYARIHKVISLKPFRMRISWLNSRSTSEFGSLDWIGSGFVKTCGDFRTGRYESSGRLNSFSHKVNWIKGARGVVQIYPRKGDAWALYRNWSPDWNKHTPDEVIYKYDMVQVLEDYNEEQGVSVSPLIKVPDFRTVFRKHTDPKEVRRIPKEEMFRFSHQVPYYSLTGQEAQNAPKDCWELDPAAFPLELVQEVTEANDQPAVGVQNTISADDMVEIPSKSEVTDVVEK